MKKRIVILWIIVFFAAGGVFNSAAQGLTVSGLLDSSVSLNAGAGDAPPFSFGIEEYLNLRMQARIRDRAIFFGAFNFIAAAGDYAYNARAMADLQSSIYGMNSSAFVAGENFIMALELERLHFRILGEHVDFDGGLMRLPFGYGQVWGPSDFLNPRNPLRPDARPRAVLGASASWFPAETLRLQGFGAAPRNPFSRNGGGGLIGLSMDQHWDMASLQALYSFELPKDGSNRGIHRAGMSLKADLEIGLMMDLLYTYNNEAGTRLDGLSFSIGADYSFFGGSLIVLAEYLYNGSASSTSIAGGGSFFNEHYLYTGATWRFNDFTNLSAALISGFSDLSFTPIITLNHDIFQGATLTVTAQIPLDRNLFSGNGSHGELGPVRTQRYFNLATRLRLRI